MRKLYIEVRDFYYSRGETLLSEFYKNTHTKLLICCPFYHQYWQTFTNSKSGKGCPYCSGRLISESKLEVKLKEMLARDIKMLSPYTKATDQHEFECLKSNCGYIWSAIFDNVSRGKGCPDCGGTRKLTIDEVRSFYKDRGEKLLSQSYKTNQVKLEIRCQRGHNYWQSYKDSRIGHKCPKCKAENNKIDYDVVKKFYEDRNEILLSDVYDRCNVKLKISCKSGHVYHQPFTHSKRGKGCPECAVKGFKPDKPAILYYLKFVHENHSYYKIGITNRTIKTRFESEPLSYAVIYEMPYPIGRDAYDLEQSILKRFKDYRFNGTPFLHSGNTELFTWDVLGLDKTG